MGTAIALLIGALVLFLIIVVAVRRRRSDRRSSGSGIGFLPLPDFDFPSIDIGE